MPTPEQLAALEAMTRENERLGLYDAPDVPLPEPLTPERIDRLADLTIKGMPDGIQGFCRTWGWQQFAAAMLENFDAQTRDYGQQCAKAARLAALTEAAMVCESRIDYREQARASLAAAKAIEEGDQQDKIDRLSHDATVNLYNGTLQRCADAIRALAAAEVAK